MPHIIKQRPPSPPLSADGEASQLLPHMHENDPQAQCPVPASVPNDNDINHQARALQVSCSPRPSNLSDHTAELRRELLHDLQNGMQPFADTPYATLPHIGPYDYVQHADPNGSHLQMSSDPHVVNYYPQRHDGYPHSMPVAHEKFVHYTIQPESPPVSSASDYSPGDRQTRGGRVLSGSEAGQIPKSGQTPKSNSPLRPRVARRTRMVKRATTKKEKPKMPKLEAPLSKLTEGYKHIPVKDMEEWVNRSPEVRQQQVEQRKGYVTRPMNSFMLYRSAYAERTKMWCLQNNHQIVSSVSGESWPLETEEIREKYHHYAKIERENHQNAHPGYKFSPSKTQNAAKKRKADANVSESDESEPSDLDDYEWGQTKSRKNKPKPRQRSDKNADTPYISSSPSFTGGPSVDGPGPSSYQATNPGRPMPMAMGGQDMVGQYYQTTRYPSTSVANVENVRMQMTASPQMQQVGYLSTLAGLPGAASQELYERSQANSPLALNEQMVDPCLLDYGNGEYGQGSNGAQDQFELLDSTQHLTMRSDNLDEGIGPEDGVSYPADTQAILPGWNETIEGLLIPSSEWQTMTDTGSEFERLFHEN